MFSKIGLKIIVMFLLILAVSVVIGWLAYATLEEEVEHTRHIIEDIIPISNELGNLDKMFLRAREIEQRYLKEGKSEKFEELSGVLAKLRTGCGALKAKAQEKGLRDISTNANQLWNLLIQYETSLGEIGKLRTSRDEMVNALQEDARSINMRFRGMFQSIPQEAAQYGVLVAKSGTFQERFSTALALMEKDETFNVPENRSQLKEALAGSARVVKDLSEFGLFPQGIASSLKADIGAIAMQLEEFSREINGNLMEVQQQLAQEHETIDGVAQKIQGYITASEEGNTIEMTATAETAQQKAAKVSMIITIIIVVAVIMAFIIGLAMIRMILNPIGTMMNTAQAVSEGDFSQRIEIASSDELGVLANCFNQMLENLKRQMEMEQESKAQLQKQVSIFSRLMDRAASGDFTAEVAMSTEEEMGRLADSFNKMTENLKILVRKAQAVSFQLSSAIEEILVATESQAEGAETQSLQISETSAAMEELTVSIQQVSENAAMAEEQAREASEVAAGGGLAVGKTIEGMNRIKDTVQKTAKTIRGLGESSQEIGAIIQVISDIAEQTNLLALNATIEAARAGEHGKGFAVVADEIRKLAERSSKATKEIAALIKRIQTETTDSVMAMEAGTKGVKEGVNLADQAGEALRQIVDVVQRTASVIKEISLAAKQQASASEGVVGAMDNISTVTKQSAHGSKETANAAHSLANMARELQNAISRFKIEKEQGRPAVQEDEQEFTLRGA